MAASSRYTGTIINNHTGKSSLTVQYCEGHFVESYYPTIENSFSHEIIYKGQTYSTEIIDTAGQVSAGCVCLHKERHQLKHRCRMSTAC